jgi:hypothetical protein
LRSHANATCTASAAAFGVLRASGVCAASGAASSSATARKLGELWVDQACQEPDLWRRYA